MAKDYVETIQEKAAALKDFGITYKAMSKQSNVGYGTIRNFMTGQRGMREDNWVRFVHYVEMTYLTIFGGKENNEK